MTSQLGPGNSQAEYDRAKAELNQLEASYKDLAVDTGLAAAGFAPPRGERQRMS